MILSNNFFYKFLGIFVGLWLFPFPLTLIPGFEFDIYEHFIPQLGKFFFGLEDISTQMTGSGDTTYAYLILLFEFVLAIILTLIWSIFGDKNMTYDKLQYWYYTLLRYFLGSVMLSYGLIKIIKTQFPDHRFSRLLQSYGDSSPMGLAWTFLGHSVGYNLFMGLAEFVGGVLLFHRKTRLLGALVLIPVISNIVAVNFFYDVPVKIFSTQLLVIAIILLLPDLNRLVSFVFNKPSQPRLLLSVFDNRNYRIGKEVLKWAFVAFILTTNLNRTIKGNKTYGRAAPKADLYGLYEVTDFAFRQDTLSSPMGDSTRWQYVIIEHNEFMQIRNKDKTKNWYKQEVDLEKKQLELREYRDESIVHTFDYVETDSTLFLSGIYKQDSITCTTKRLGKEDFLLTSRGFNWITERPFNR